MFVILRAIPFTCNYIVFFLACHPVSLGNGRPGVFKHVTEHDLELACRYTLVISVHMLLLNLLYPDNSVKERTELVVV